MASFASCSEIMRGAAEILRPPRRIPVVDAVEQHMRIYLPGGSNENWNRERTPYMVKPMNRLADRSVEGVVFVGPSRSGKTAALVDGFLVYAVVCDPGDMHIIHMTQATAQRFSQSRIDRLNEHSPAMRERLSPYASDDNVFGKRYRHGMTLSIGWPSITQLSSFDIRYVCLTDYDRFPEDVGREGDVVPRLPPHETQPRRPASGPKPSCRLAKSWWSPAPARSSPTRNGSTTTRTKARPAAEFSPFTTRATATDGTGHATIALTTSPPRRPVTHSPSWTATPA